MKKLLLTAVLLVFAASSVYAQPVSEPDAKAPATMKNEPKKEEPASQPVGTSLPVDKNEPKDAGEAFDKGKEAVSLAREGKWMAFSALVIYILMFLLKLARKNFNFMKNLKKRWLYIILGVLSLAAMLLSKFQGDLSWGAAMNVLTSSAATGVLNDILKRGILGKEPTTAVNGGVS
jgi:hypothetical protein